MNTQIHHQIISLLRRRTGAEMAITTRAICRELGLPETREREVRRFLQAARSRDDLGEFPLLSRPGKGWFLAASAAEWTERGRLILKLLQAARNLLETHNRKSGALGFPPAACEDLQS
jgi:hypothetical protein